VIVVEGCNHLSVRVKVLAVLGVVIALVAILIAASIPAAASIMVPIRTATIGAAGFLSVFLILWMVNQFGSTK